MEQHDPKLTTEDLASGGTETRSEATEGTAEDARPYGEPPAGTRERELNDPESADYESRERATATEAGAGASASEPLLAQGDAADFRAQWESIQAGFVDEPRSAVEQADALVATLMQRLADMFSQERKGLESQWDRGSDVSTEDLRVALQRYRSFFDRLLSA